MNISPSLFLFPQKKSPLFRKTNPSRQYFTQIKIDKTLKKVADNK